MTESVKGKTVEEAHQLFDGFRHMLTGVAEEQGVQLGKLLRGEVTILGVAISRGFSVGSSFAVLLVAGLFPIAHGLVVCPLDLSLCLCRGFAEAQLLQTPVQGRPAEPEYLCSGPHITTNPPEHSLYLGALCLLKHSLEAASLKLLSLAHQP